MFWLLLHLLAICSVTCADNNTCNNGTWAIVGSTPHCISSAWTPRISKSDDTRMTMAMLFSCFVYTFTWLKITGDFTECYKIYSSHIDYIPRERTLCHRKLSFVLRWYIVPVFTMLYDLANVGMDFLYFFRLEGGDETLLSTAITRNVYVNNAMYMFSILGSLFKCPVIAMILVWNMNDVKKKLKMLIRPADFPLRTTIADIPLDAMTPEARTASLLKEIKLEVESEGREAECLRRNRALLREAEDKSTLVSKPIMLTINLLLEDGVQVILQFYFVDKYTTSMDTMVLFNATFMALASVYAFLNRPRDVSKAHWKKVRAASFSVGHSICAVALAYWPIIATCAITGLRAYACWHQATAGEIHGHCLTVTEAGILIQTPFAGGCMGVVDWILLVYTASTVVVVIPVLLVYYLCTMFLRRISNVYVQTPALRYA